MLFRSVPTVEFGIAIQKLEYGEVDGVSLSGASARVQVATDALLYFTNCTMAQNGGKWFWTGMVAFGDTPVSAGQKHVVAIEKAGSPAAFAATSKTIAAGDISNPMGIQFNKVTLTAMPVPAVTAGTDKVTFKLTIPAAAQSAAGDIYGFKVYAQTDGAGAYAEVANVTYAEATGAAGKDITAVHGHSYKYRYKIMYAGSNIYLGKYDSPESASVTPTAPAVPQPQITSINHDYGSVSGGLSVSLVGNNFDSTEVLVDGAVVASSGDANHIIFTMPAHAAGIVKIRVRKTADNTKFSEANFTYLNNPTIDTVSPNHGAAAGGNDVEISGTNLYQNKTVTVKFGGSGATVKSNTDAKLVVTVHAHAAGAVSVEVDLGNGVKSTKANAYTYDNPPAGLDITGINPSSCKVGESPAAVITGTGFNTMNGNANAKVRFGTTDAQFTVQDDTHINVVVPNTLAEGKYDVAVDNGTASDALTQGFTVQAVIPTEPYGLIDNFENGTILNSEILTKQQGANVDWWTWSDAGLLSFQETTTAANINGTKGAKISGTDSAGNDGYIGGFGIYTSKDVSANANLNAFSMYVANTGSKAITLKISLIDDDNNDFTAHQTPSFEYDNDDQWVATLNIPAGTAKTKYEIPFTSFKDENSYGDGIRNMEKANNGGAGLVQIGVDISSEAGASVEFTIDDVTLAQAGVAQPTIDTVVPTSGVVGTEVTITGTNFSNPTVMFGNTQATQINSSSATQIKVTAPSHAAGTVDITVSNSGGASVTKTQAFTYIDATVMTIFSISPTTGIAGIPLTITGALLSNGAEPEVYFGATANATSAAKAAVTSYTDQTVIVTVPGNVLSGSTVDVWVKRADGTIAKSPTQFTYSIAALGNLDIEQLVVDGSTVRNNDYVNDPMKSVVVHVLFKNSAVPSTGTATLTIGSTSVVATFNTPTTVDGKLKSLATLTAAQLTELSNALNSGTNEISVSALSAQAATSDVVTYSVKVAATSDQVALMPLPDGNYLLNYPNPFNPNGGQTTDIAFMLNKEATIAIYMYDVKGTLIFKRDIQANAGYNTYTWDGKSDFGDTCGTGTYFYRMVANNGQKVLGTGKLTIINNK